ncbi:CpsD/CapB family tyrosine-protein kinase [uncultured Desulfosarcina sp.]|uniref:CpsD/CapB family tyrosine-protein kinase n=1 Tax=uncultured Desulfosarcina sp. TaxID=218289 RepID=UPI0029C81A73|nr:CpsD/CapB family tyrosine-protein kinase [uncultured Desulfosarcina sp.]
MGKIHDALEKSGRANELKTIPSAGSHSVEVQAVKNEIKAKAPISPLTLPASGSGKIGPKEIDPNLITYHDPVSVEAEIFKILRTNILFPKTGHPPRTIMVTSAIPGDGKSFVAANLAISIAQGIEEHVLLMDCDMRRSSIHNCFGYRGTVPGLSDYLSNKQSLERLLKKTVVDKLTLLPGGTPPHNPAELLSSQAMKNLIKEAKERYRDRYIIVDSPPPQLTAETAALAKTIDAIIVVVKYASTPKDLVKELIIKLGREKVIGVVMNGYRVPLTERYGYGKYKK